MKAGRKAIKYDPELAEKIREMRGSGFTLEMTANAAGMSVPTLCRLYSDELREGCARANLAVGKRLFEKCMEGDITALIFWAKTRMGWSEKQKIDISSEDGNLNKKPEPVINIDLSKMTPEELSAMVDAAWPDGASGL